MDSGLAGVAVIRLMTNPRLKPYLSSAMRAAFDKGLTKARAIQQLGISHSTFRKYAEALNLPFSLGRMQVSPEPPPPNLPYVRPPRIMSERDTQIIDRAKLGETFSSIAVPFGITRERVRQIVDRSGILVPTMHAARAIVSDVRKAAKQERRDAKRKAIADLVEKVAAGQSIRSVAIAAGIAIDTLRSHVKAAGVESHHGRWRTSPSPSQRKAVDLYNSGMTMEEVASRVGRSAPFVRRSIDLVGGVVVRRSRGGQPIPYDPVLGGRIAGVYLSGKTIEQTAADLGLSTGKVARMLAKGGVQMRSPGWVSRGVR